MTYRKVCDRCGNALSFTDDEKWALALGAYVVDLCWGCKWDLADWLGAAFRHPSIDMIRTLWPKRGARPRPDRRITRDRSGYWTRRRG